MFIIAGLGNPGREYENTRHNVGFATIDILSDKHGISLSEEKHKGLYGKGIIAGEKCVLLKPLTYMNLSGECIRELADYYKTDTRSELIVISDEVSLDVGNIRVRPKGSAGGHNGLKNIIQMLGHDEFTRVRIGVGNKPREYKLVDYVLGHFQGDDIPVIADSYKLAADACESIISEGVQEAMNKYNRKNSAE